MQMVAEGASNALMRVRISPNALDKFEYIHRLEMELDKQFPKGDKARGRALVLFATAKMFIAEVIPTDCAECGRSLRKNIRNKLR